MKKAASAVIAVTYLDYWNEVAKDLIMQGDFLRLLAEEESHMTWQSYKYSLPKGVIGWAARADSAFRHKKQKYADLAKKTYFFVSISVHF